MTVINNQGDTVNKYRLTMIGGDSLVVETTMRLGDWQWRIEKKEVILLGSAVIACGSISHVQLFVASVPKLAETAEDAS